MTNLVYVCAPLQDRPVHNWLGDLHSAATEEVASFPGQSLHSPRVKDWGIPPHIPVLAPIVVADPAGYIQAIQEICIRHAPPKIWPLDYHLLGSNLIANCVSPELGDLRSRLILETRHQIDRSKLSDEECQRSLWRIEECGGLAASRLAFFDAEERYKEFGEPSLPTSRDYRSNYFMNLVGERRQAGDGPDSEAAERRLFHYLTFCEPADYSDAYSPYVALAGCSGQFVPACVSEWPSAQALIGAAPPKYLSLMAEDLDHEVKVRVFDSLTGRWVCDKRHHLVEIDRAYFAR